MNERRKFMRFDVAIEIEYMVPGNGIPVEGISIAKNISREGIQVALNSKLLPCTEIEMKLKIPGDAGPSYAKGDLVWIDKDDANAEAAAGIKLTQISPFDRTRILDYVYKQWINQQLGRDIRENK